MSDANFRQYQRLMFQNQSLDGQGIDEKILGQ
jgi:hypothetical protein